MALYYYNKYNAALSSTTYSSPSYNESATWSSSYQMYQTQYGATYSFTSGTTGFRAANYNWISTYVSPPTYSYHYGSEGQYLYRKIIDGPTGQDEYGRDIYLVYSQLYGTCTATPGSYYKTTFVGTVVAENGTYPNNGYYATDGYWYVRGAQVSTTAFYGQI